MQRLRPLLLPVILVLGLTAGLPTDATARTAPTAISTDEQALSQDPLWICTPLIEKKNFIGNIFSKIANLPNTTKISDVGYLINALSGEAVQATRAGNNSFQVKNALPYLLKSKELQDSLKLRRKARYLKYTILNEALAQVKDLPAEAQDAIKKYLAAAVDAPLIMFDKSPLPAFIPEPGPCLIPVGVEVLDAARNRLRLETSVICLLDIESEGKKLFSLKDAIDNDTLDLVLAHENAHGIQFDMYGQAWGQIERISTNGHDAPYITDLGMALIEGWAEAFEALYGPANPKLKEKDRKKYNISEFLYARQDPIRRDRYVWASTGKQTGVMKNALQMMSTEGVIAGLFYDILINRKINGAFEKCVTVFLTAQPKSFPQFVKAFVEAFPDDKRIIYRILLETTNYVTMSNDAAKLYKAYYDAHRDYQQKKIEKAEADKARQAFLTFKEDLFEKAMAGANVFANVGPEMWFSGVIRLNQKHSFLDFKYHLLKKLGKDTDVIPMNIDLNTVKAGMLVYMGMSEEDAIALIKARAERGAFFHGDPLQIIEKQLGPEKYAAFKAKAQLKPYESKSRTNPESQAASLWPEDIEKLAEAAGK